VFAHVAIPRSAPEPLTYLVPPELEPFAIPGVRVRVPMRKRIATGILIDLSETSSLDSSVVRPIDEVLDLNPLLPAQLLDLARFVADYYRCPIGTTLASMLPARLLRGDAEEAVLTTTGAATSPEELPARQAAVLSELQRSTRVRMTTLLARAGVADRRPLDSLVDGGLATIKARRRDRPPKTEVTAVQLAATPIKELLETLARAPKQRQVVEWLAELDRPALISEVTGAVGCSRATIRALLDRGALLSFTQAPPRRPRWSLPSAAERFQLTDEQRIAVDTVKTAVERGGYTPFLLEGVTGSGKTEVYIRCLEAVLDSDRSGLVLVPEIGLTPAAAGAVEARFGTRTAVLHSAQSEGERWREWQRAREGDARVVVGPRSALFSPLEDLGLIVVDEEHDAAYKQQEAPRYHARDLALVLGKRLGIPVLLCAATPSVEAAALVKRELASHLRLTRRVAGGTLPEVEIVDLRNEAPDAGEQGHTLFSRRLREAVGATLEKGDQIILLNHRRGWAPLLMCRDCGTRIECSSCSVSMVVHQRSGDLRCHYCGRRVALPRCCDSCSGRLLDPVGAGTEKIAHRLGELFPEAGVAILDRDTVRRRDGLRDSLGAFAAGEAQILVGTQMVAKGHHFPNVTLTGVISADALLGLPDFRAGERTFQLLTQVAGRAGRGSKAGRVIIQTYYPDHPAVRHACRHDVGAFLEEELLFRRAFSYPPVARMAVVRFESRSDSAARRATEAAARLVTAPSEGLRLRGPAPAPIERIRGKWRWQLLLSAANRGRLRRALEEIEADQPARGVRRIVDVDPLSTL
jgi:primosomal protein N' (replication factor Y)